MAQYEIRTWGDPILRKKTEKITEFDEELKQLINDLLETMYASSGVGLAANQIGISKKLLVLDSGTPEEPKVLMLCNPEVSEVSKDKTEFEEGCLSFPGITEKIIRPSTVKVKAQDKDGNNVEINAEGLTAVVLQHEIDHLNGVIFTDRMSALRKLSHSKELKELKKEYKKNRL